MTGPPDWATTPQATCRATTKWGQMNSADTLQPYEPGKVIGSQDPVLPVPAAKGGGCGGLGKIIVLVVAVVVAAVTQQWWLVNMAANPYVAGAVGAAAGSVASQVVGMAIGEQDSFSWKSVGLAALSGGITSGLADTQLLGGKGLEMTAARAATANALTQGIGVVTGLQKSFDWKGVAGAAAGAGVGWGLNEALGVTVGGERNLNANASNQAFFGMGAAGAVLRGTLSGLGAGTAAAVARGGKVAIQQVATDAFGNALGSSLAEAASSGSYRGEGTSRRPYVTDAGEQIVFNNTAPANNFARVDAIMASAPDWGNAGLPEVDRSNDVLVAVGNRLPLTGVTSDADDNLYLSIIANAQARNLQRSTEQARAAAYQARASQLSSDQYASGAGDVRGPFYSQADASDPFVMESSIVAAQGLKGPSEGFWRGLSGDSRSVLEGPSSFGENLGLTVNGLVTSPVRTAYGLVSEIGREYKDAYNLLTRDASSYVPLSGLGSSLNQQGLWGTLGDVSYALGSAPTKPVFDLLKGDYKAFGEGLPSMAAMGMGAVRGVGAGLKLSSAGEGLGANRSISDIAIEYSSQGNGKLSNASMVGKVDGTPTTLGNMKYVYEESGSSKIVSVNMYEINPEFRGQGLSTKLFADVQARHQANLFEGSAGFENSSVLSKTGDVALTPWAKSLNRLGFDTNYDPYMGMMNLVKRTGP